MADTNTRVWTNICYRRPKSKLQKQIDAFVQRCFELRGKDMEKDSLSKRDVEILFVDRMHENGEFEAFNQKSFNRVFNLFEEDEVIENVKPECPDWSSESEVSDY